MFLLSCIAPFAPLKVSPTSAIFAELSPPEEFGIETFIEKVKETKIPIKNRNLDLLVHSPGGGVESAYMIAKTLRKNFSKIRAYVPHIATSGATLVAISCNEVIMGEISRLSPIDISTISKMEKGFPC